jgi:CRP-like cAMP-binding protein
MQTPTNLQANKLKDSFDKYFNAPIETWNVFAKYCEPVSYKKEVVIKPSNNRERFFYFILRGSAGVFLWRGNNFVCLDIVLENSFFCDYLSLLNREVSPLQTISIEESEMLRMTAADFYKIGSEQVAQKILRFAAEAAFMDKQQQQIDLLTKTARERYLDLTSRYPEIPKRIPQKYIASYLGITPQSMSRIRRSIK